MGKALLISFVIFGIIFISFVAAYQGPEEALLTLLRMLATYCGGAIVSTLAYNFMQEKFESEKERDNRDEDN